MAQQRYLEVVKEFRFEAAHVLPRHPGKCSRLHGHSWLMRVGVRAPVNPETGFVVDYCDLKAMVQPIIDRWDHSYLGAVPFLVQDDRYEAPEKLEASFYGYPSSENLVMYVVRCLLDHMRVHPFPGELVGDASAIPTLSLVEIEETCTSRCTWRP